MPEGSIAIAARSGATLPGPRRQAGTQLPIEIAIVGVGPWGLCVLERLTSALHCRSATGLRVRAHVVEPGRPGSGLYGAGEPDYLVLNTPCGQHSLHPSPDDTKSVRFASSFFEWAQDRGYQWVGTRCRTGCRGTPIGPDDFLPRRLMGEYLEWFYRRLVADAPPELEIVHHGAAATDIVGGFDQQQCVILSDGRTLHVDHVVLTTGHPGAGPTADRPWVTSPYPTRPYVDRVGAGDHVGVSGMGLVALDVVTALTIGRGGTYSDEGGCFRYHPSGHEPAIHLYSRGGFPYCAKSAGTRDPAGEYRPVICTPDAVASLRRRAGSASRRYGIDARRDLLPLIAAEMQVRFFSQSALVRDGPAAASDLVEHLLRAWRGGTMSQAVAGATVRYGHFDVARHLSPAGGEQFVSARDYEMAVQRMLRADVKEALVARGTSPVKAAYEVLRALRDTIRSAVEFGGLAPASQLDFRRDISKKLTRLVAGPPAFRSQQLLALVDAGIVRTPFGPSPSVQGGHDRGPGHLSETRIVSEHLAQPHEQRVDWLVRGHLDEPSIHRSTSPLLRSLVRRGRVAQACPEGCPVGGVDLSGEFHPVSRSGNVEQRLWLFGSLTEGARYFTHYIPSPKSRVRAFRDAEVCVDKVLGGRV